MPLESYMFLWDLELKFYEAVHLEVAILATLLEL